MNASILYYFPQIPAKKVYSFPGSPPFKKQGNHRKSYMVIYENIKVIESNIEVYGYMQVIKRHTIV